MRPPQSKSIRLLLAVVSLTPALSLTPASLLPAELLRAAGPSILALLFSLINQPEGHELQSLGRCWESQRPEDLPVLFAGPILSSAWVRGVQLCVASEAGASSVWGTTSSCRRPTAATVG